MHITIDASNIRGGGGATHLQEILEAVDLSQFEIDKLSIWAPSKTLERLPAISKVEYKRHRMIDAGRYRGNVFRQFLLDSAIDPDSDLLWIPGGSYSGKFEPFATMVQNLLPFDDIWRDAYGWSGEGLRLKLLRIKQLSTFRRAAGIIHLSQKSYDDINAQLKGVCPMHAIIPHGLNKNFVYDAKPQIDSEAYSRNKPYQILYVSRLDIYKNQVNLLYAVSQLVESGLPLKVKFIGSANPAGKRAFDKAKHSLDPLGLWSTWQKEASYEEMRGLYREADMCVVLSSCESFGMILLEAMASGNPVLSSVSSALPEVNGGACPEVNPESVADISSGIQMLFEDRILREKTIERALNRVKAFSWQKCASATFSFLASVASSKNIIK